MNQIDEQLGQNITEPFGTVDDSGLPSPKQLPLADLVIFDGQCVFCTNQVKKLHALDGKNRLAFISLHDRFVSDHIPDLDHEQMMEQMYIVPHTGSGYSPQRLGGADGIRYLTRRLPKLWALAPFFHIPFTRPIQQWCYRQIAKRRYRIAGKSAPACDDNGTCDLHFKD